MQEGCAERRSLRRRQGGNGAERFPSNKKNLCCRPVLKVLKVSKALNALSPPSPKHPTTLCSPLYIGRDLIVRRRQEEARRPFVADATRVLTFSQNFKHKGITAPTTNSGYPNEGPFVEPLSAIFQQGGSRRPLGADATRVARKQPWCGAQGWGFGVWG